MRRLCNDQHETHPRSISWLPKAAPSHSKPPLPCAPREDAQKRLPGREAGAALTRICVAGCVPAQGVPPLPTQAPQPSFAAHFKPTQAPVPRRTWLHPYPGVAMRTQGGKMHVKLRVCAELTHGGLGDGGSVGRLTRMRTFCTIRACWLRSVILCFTFLFELE